MSEYNKKLISYIKENKNKRDLFICNIEHVSASGMTRWIKVGMIYKRKFIDISPLFINMAGQKRYLNHEGVKITGCGMDMCFALLQDFAHNIGIENPLNEDAFQHYINF